MRYPFLQLVILIWIPTIAILFIRKDLRKYSVFLMAYSLPFAFTETLFYPDYWRPVVIGGLIQKIGFSLEDILFVTGLAGWGSFYAVLANKTLAKMPGTDSACFPFKPIVFIGAVIISALALKAFTSVPFIYLTFAAMIAALTIIIAKRGDLWKPALYGGLLCSAVYFAICIILEISYPGVFEKYWVKDGFFQLHLGVIPANEIIYAGLAGACAQAFIPFAHNKFYVPVKGRK